MTLNGMTIIIMKLIRIAVSIIMPNEMTANIMTLIRMTIILMILSGMTIIIMKLMRIMMPLSSYPYQGPML
jgi:hypothetical protein